MGMNILKAFHFLICYSIFQILSELKKRVLIAEHPFFKILFFN
jgi:hypothetical protein